MQRLAALPVLALTLALGGVAHAGGYVGLGVGSDADLGGELGERFSSDGLDSQRLILGQTLSAGLSIELALFGTELASGAGMDADYRSTSLGVGLRYTASLLGPLDGYVRGGLNRTWLMAERDGAMEPDGRGYDLGAGLQLVLPILPSLDAALWLDYDHQVVALAGDGARLDGTAEMVTLGITVGSDL